jgi:hypothetical protein
MIESLFWSPAFRITVCVILAIAAGVAGYLLVVKDEDKGGPDVGPDASVAPVQGTEEDLVALADELGYPIYWLGEREGTKLEITSLSDGQVYVRYLGEDDPIGDPRSDFLTVGTYPVDDPHGELLELSERKGTTEESLEQRGLAVQIEDAPHSAYFAWPDGEVQVEVYSPQPGEALRLALAGDVLPAR